MSQRSKSTKKRIEIMPVSEAPLDDDSISRFRGRYRQAFGVPLDNDFIYASVSAGQRQSGYEHWLPFFHNQLETLFDYLPEATICFDHQWENAFRHGVKLSKIIFRRVSSSCHQIFELQFRKMNRFISQ